MNYKHLYHAGNFCDVFKHITLMSLIDFLKKKDKPFCYLETHAGSGRYDLNSLEALKTQEFKNGIAKFVDFLESTEYVQNFEVIEKYLKIVKAEGFPDYYPGSPKIVESVLRSADRMLLMELNTIEAHALKNIFHNNKKIAVHQMDGYQGLKAFLPPKEQRGLIFIDPPYEKMSEIEELIKHLAIAYKRFSMGVYVIWYPIKNKAIVDKFQQELQNFEALVERNLEITITEMSIYPEDIMGGLIGSGMAIINPPWQWKESFEKILPWLWKALSVSEQGSYRIFDLKI